MDIANGITDGEVMLELAIEQNLVRMSLYLACCKNSSLRFYRLDVIFCISTYIRTAVIYRSIQHDAEWWNLKLLLQYRL